MGISQPFPIYPRQASVPRNQSNRMVTLPSPVGGWNTRDDPTNMPPQDAVRLKNMVPRHNYCEMRGGYESHSTGVGSGDIDMLAEFYDGTNRHLLSASATNIYNSTAVGAASSLGSGFSNGRWDTAMMNGVMGFVNGADAPQKYNGSTLSAMTVSGSGLTTTQIIGINVFKSRSYFWEANSPNFWYSSLNALGGALTEFPLGDVAKKGGKLLRMISWTVDGGSGPDDYAVFVMSSGEVIVFQGDNPGSVLSWGLVGTYEVGEPVNDRCIMRYGREIMVVVENDIISLPSAFAQPTPPASKLTGAISSAVASLSGNNGWELFWYPNESLIFINVPVALSPDAFEQYVLNLQTGAAARFTDIPSRCWTMFNGTPYFGSTDGIVYKFDSTEADAGSEIDVDVLMGWGNFGAPQYKMVTAVRPTFKTEQGLLLDFKVGYDFVEPTVSSPSSTATGGGAPWGSAWGTSWGGAVEVIQSPWRVANGRGTAVALGLKFSRQGDRPKWYKTEYLVKLEGNL